MDTKSLNQKFYDVAADSYNEKYNRDDSERSLETYLKLFDDFVGKKKKILDIGCAGGVNMPVIRRFDPELVVGVDLSPKMIELARSSYGEDPRFMFINSAIQDLELGEKFDVIFAMLSMVHIPPTEIEIVLKKIKKLMGSGAFFLANYFEGNNEEIELAYPEMIGNKNLRRRFSYYSEEFLQDVYKRTGFEIVSLVRSPGSSFERINILAK